MNREQRRIEDIILFTMSNNLKHIDIYPIKDFYQYLSRLDQLGQLIVVYEKGEIDGYIGYFRVNEKDIENIMENQGKSWYIPPEQAEGGIIFVDIAVCKKGKNVLKILIDKIREKEINSKLGCWVSRNHKFNIVNGRSKAYA